MILAAPAVFFVSPYLDVFVPNLNFKNYFLASLPVLMLYQLALGIALGAITTGVRVIIGVDRPYGE